MGQPMYERLGFREVCAVNVYEWSPFTPPTTEPGTSRAGRRCTAGRAESATKGRDNLRGERR
jgi:hypothetical protein